VDDPNGKASLLAMAASWKRLAEVVSALEPVNRDDDQKS
jgi:hypothetical protein